MAQYEEDDDVGSAVVTRKKTRTRLPRMYKVIMFNDDYTSMEFVVEILESIFQKVPVEATQIMLEIHRKGSGVCGIYPKDVAESKVKQVEERALEKGFPLLCSVEPA